MNGGGDPAVGSEMACDWRRSRRHRPRQDSDTERRKHSEHLEERDHTERTEHSQYFHALFSIRRLARAGPVKML